MSYETILILIVIGIFGGAWNAVAGGATLFTFPALMAVGLPPVVANATNYLALLPRTRLPCPPIARNSKASAQRCGPC